MEIGEAGKLLNLNDQKLFTTLIDDVELIPGFKELTEHKKSLKTIIENNLQELTLKTSKKIQRYKISEELEKELTYFARIKNYQDTDIQANIDVIIDNIPNTRAATANPLDFFSSIIHPPYFDIIYIYYTVNSSIMQYQNNKKLRKY